MAKLTLDAYSGVESDNSRRRLRYHYPSSPSQSAQAVQPLLIIIIIAGRGVQVKPVTALITSEILTSLYHSNAIPYIVLKLRYWPESHCCLDFGSVYKVSEWRTGYYQ